MTNSIYQGHLYLSDLSESKFKVNSQPVIIKRFFYEVRRPIAQGDMSGDSSIGDVCLTVSFGNKTAAPAFLKHLQSFQEQTYTVLFDDVISDNEVKEFHSGVIIRGFVYDVEELFSERSSFSVRIKPTKLTFISEDSQKELNIYKD